MTGGFHPVLVRLKEVYLKGSFALLSPMEDLHRWHKWKMTMRNTLKTSSCRHTAQFGGRELTSPCEPVTELTLHPAGSS